MEVEDIFEDMAVKARQRITWQRTVVERITKLSESLAKLMLEMPGDVETVANESMLLAQIREFQGQVDDLAARVRSGEV